MKKTLLLITLALLAGCNESKLAADNSTPPAGDDDDDGGTGGVIPVAVVLAGGGGGAGTLFDGTSSYDPDDASADAIATFTWALVICATLYMLCLSLFANIHPIF